MGSKRKRNQPGQMKIKRYMRVVILFLILPVMVLAQEPDRLQIHQVYVKKPSVTVYVDVTDIDGNRVEQIAKSQFTATLDEHQATVTSLTPFEKTGDGTAYLVLVDISKSMKGVFGQIRESLTIWINDMKEADWMTILTFGDSAKKEIDFTGDKEALKKKVKELEPNADNTQLYKALQKAREIDEQRRDTVLPTRRVVVVLSDGKDEGSGLTDHQVQELKNRIKKYHLPIYAIGYSTLRNRKDYYLGILSNFAEISGGVYKKAQGDNLREMYKIIRQSILSVYRLELNCETVPADGQEHRLQVNLKAGAKELSKGMDIRILREVIGQPAVVPVKKDDKLPLWVYAAGIGGLLLIVVFFIMIRRKKEPIPGGEETEMPPSEDRAGPVSSPKTGGSLPEKSKTGGIAVQLVEIGGRGENHEYNILLSDIAIIGREPGCDAALEGDMDISREHFELSRENGSVLIRDLGTTNGTKVNGVPITSRFRLESGDKIQVGRTELRVLFQRETS